MKKVRGEVNPADLFTKHLASREKVHQLLGLFGCEYRQGRAQAAPLLRPMDSDDRQGGHSIEGDMLPAYSAEIEPELHDAGRLPHLHSEAEIAKMFPTIPAAPAQPNLNDWNPTCVDELPQVDPDRACVDELPQKGQRLVCVDELPQASAVVGKKVVTEIRRAGSRRSERSPVSHK